LVVRLQSFVFISFNLCLLTKSFLALVASCAAVNVTLNKTELALALPATWDGPTGIGLGMPLTVVGVITAFTLAMGAIITLSSL
jgi:hypothetical protein